MLVYNNQKMQYSDDDILLDDTELEIDYNNEINDLDENEQKTNEKNQIVCYTIH
jgi:hypothetical protein